jgi:[NiFe] hydrogenase assembly HybE family chaperone
MIGVEQLAKRYRTISETRMQGLPIVNDKLGVETVGFRDWQGHRLGVLITPWFMNLIALPADDHWSECEQGELISCEFPSGNCELTVTCDEELGQFLSAILFRTVTDFPDQETARLVAEETLSKLFEEPVAPQGKVSRRNIFTGLKAG